MTIVSVLIACSTPKTYPKVSDFKYHKISDINNLNPKEGEQFNTEGYVVRIYECPPCPKESICEPCFTNDFIIISEDNQLNNKILGRENLSKNELLIYTTEADKFELGKKYKVSVKVLYSNHLNIDFTNDIELVGYEVIKG